MAVVFFVSIYAIFFSAPYNFPENYIVEVVDGATASETAQILFDEGIIKRKFIFTTLVILRGRERGVLSGIYYFDDKSNVFTIVNKMTNGDFGIIPKKITIPEGFTNRDIAGVLAKAFPSITIEEFLDTASTSEGYLFPDTYFFLPHVKSEDIVIQMRDNFDDKISEVKRSIKKADRTIEEIVIMASILEKEASDTETRRNIAGVLWKRLEINMPLQVDATLTYAVGRNTYELTQADLNGDSPYNTYKNLGLPVGPIANPGMDSITAAIEYEENPYFYYLSDRSGNTYYAETFEGHKENRRNFLN
tara:strand:+ start:3299 stop:4213 length:915 start_codon:yes stop_codon:yes gene_type:complete